MRVIISQKASISGSRRESKRKQRLSSPFNRVSFLKNTSSFSFFSSRLFWSLKSGKIYANFSGEIVTSSSALDHRVGFVLAKKMILYTHICRIKGCGGAGWPPPPIIFERLKLPQQIIYRRKENLSESPNHQKYWENILVSFYEQFSRRRPFWKFEISNS